MPRQIFSSSAKNLVDVEFTEGMPLCQIIKNLQNIPNLQIVLWYIGCYGLKKTCVEFYKKFIISPTLETTFNTTFWLVDLTAWNSFKIKKNSINHYNSCSTTIDSFPAKIIKSLKSSSIFEKMCNINCMLEINYLKTALARDFLIQPSQHFSKSLVQIDEIFPKNSWIATHFLGQDTAKTYSIFQYLEAYLIIDELITKVAPSPESNSLEIAFLLPNDELKYYRDQANSFQKDIEFLLTKRAHISPINLKIKFFNFQYGNSPEHRPYNAPGKTFKKNKLTYEDIVGPIKKEHLKKV
jgi:hypothetical protein